MTNLLNKWPKSIPPLTDEQQYINDDYVRYWHEQLAKHYSLIEKFNHGYPVAHIPQEFLRTLEIGAGLGEHLEYENLTDEQKRNYVALELRENMAEKIRLRFPGVITQVADCQEVLPFQDGYFDRVLAIHVLEHLPDLPSAIKEIYRTCNKQKGIFSIVIPCEGGMLYSFARRISAQRLFEKRYKQPYKWFIEREHLNTPNEIFEELEPYFEIVHRSFFPFYLPIVSCNLCIGLTLKPK